MVALLLFCSSALGAPLQEVLTQELNRAVVALAAEEPGVHYAAVSLETQERIRLGARSGVLDQEDAWTTRYLDVDLRVGTVQLDSTHPLRGASSWRGGNRGPIEVAWSANPERAIRQAVWKEIERRYRDAAEAIVLVEAERNVKVAEEHPAADFSPSVAQEHRSSTPAIELQMEAWRALLLEVSARLDADSVVETSGVNLSARRTETVFVDTEGAGLVHGRRNFSLVLSATATVEDGDQVSVSKRYQAHDASGLPGREELFSQAEALVVELRAKCEAPRGEPWSGPVLLSGEAAGVFFHEVLGHRLEGHRQKRDWEGKTFLDRLGEPILPDVVEIVDDPTLAEFEGVDLNGYYEFDNEGVPSQRTVLVEDGVLRGFLMSRSPIGGFPQSSGHGRRSPGSAPLARMGNLVVQVQGGESREVLREKLRVLAREQGQEYGLLVDGIEGGFTETGRMTPNAFNVRAHNSWRVWVDGRADERVRGIDLVGTPLVAFGNLVGFGDTGGVFNGTCGAESGWVPVSAISPDMLFASLEIQRKEKAETRPPLLERPVGAEGADLGSALLDEMKRAQQALKLPGAPNVYYMRGHLLSLERVYASASMGSLKQLRTAPLRQAAVEVRVGAAQFDNTGFGGWETGRVRSRLPVASDSSVVRRVTWSLADRAYKNAVEQFARKEAVFQPPPEHPGDFEIREPTIYRPPQASEELDEQRLSLLAEELSGVFSDIVGLELGQVDLVAGQGTVQVVDTLGTDVLSQAGGVRLRASAHARAADGMLLTDHRTWSVRQQKGLPELNALKSEVSGLGRTLSERAKLPRFEQEYVGPVLFEEEAALELFRSVLFGQLEGSPEVLPFETWLGDMGQGMFSPSGGSGARLGRRVLPSGWRVVDDPLSQPGEMGSFTHDAEGTPAEAVELVQDGIVRALVMSRIPRTDQASNGHARGALGRRLEGRMSQVKITPGAVLGSRRLHRKAIRASKAYGRDYVLVVRRFQEDAVRELDNAAPRVWREEQDTVVLSLPVEVIRRYADGREEVLRGAAFSGVNRWVLRDVLGAGSLVSGIVYSAWDNGQMPAAMEHGMPIWMQAPAVLVGEMELVPLPPDPRRVRRIPPPG